jgi:hypothetical protein
VGGRVSVGTVQGLVYTAGVLVAPHILSIYEGKEGKSQKLDENGRKKERKDQSKKESRKERKEIKDQSKKERK